MYIFLLLASFFYFENCIAQKDTIYNITVQDEEFFKRRVFLLEAMIRLRTHPLLNPLTDSSWSKTEKISGEGIIIKMKSDLYWKTDSMPPRKPKLFMLKTLLTNARNKPAVLDRLKYNQLVSEFRNYDNIESINAYSSLIDSIHSETYKTQFIFIYNENGHLVIKEKYLAPIH